MGSSTGVLVRSGAWYAVASEAEDAVLGELRALGADMSEFEEMIKGNLAQGKDKLRVLFEAQPLLAAAVEAVVRARMRETEEEEEEQPAEDASGTTGEADGGEAGPEADESLRAADARQ